MKKLLFPLLLFIALLLGCTPKPQKKLNFTEQIKLLKEAAEKPTKDTSQVNAIFRYLERQYHLDDIVETRKYLNLAKAISEKTNYICGEAICHEYKAAIYLKTHEFDSAKIFLNNDALLKKCGDEKWKYWHQLNLVVLGRRLNSIDQDSALQIYLQCKQAFDKMGYALGRGICSQNIGMIYLESSQIDSFLHYSDKAVQIYESANIIEKLEDALMNRGVAYYYKGNVNSAIADMFKSSTLSEIIGNKENQILTLMNIAAIYNLNNQFEKCEEFSRKVLSMIKPPYTPAQHELLSNIYTNLGTAYNHNSSMFNQDSLIHMANMAMFYFRKAQNTSQNISTIYNNYGIILSYQGKYEEALQYIDTGLRYAEKMENPVEIANSYISKGYVYIKQDKMKEAIVWNKKAVEIAQSAGDFLHIKDAAGNLKEYFHITGNCEDEIKYADIYFSARDSFESKDQAVKFAEAETQKTYEIKLARDKAEQEKKEALAEKEAQKQRMVRNSFIGGFFLTSLLAITLFRSYKRKQKDNAIISKEKERSEHLLLNILPAEVAEELKAKGESEARDFEEVTVLFTDFKSFTQFSEKVSAKELVAELNTCFRFFDGVMEKYNIEKIKTIGDSYMAAGGLKGAEPDIVKRVVMAGLEMQDFIQTLKKKRESEGSLAFDMRVGIHTGPVVAGIVGVKKFAYDIWGDTVNTASRMESSGAPGKVNISEYTYANIKDETCFIFSPRGKVMAKGKGEMDMYFVDYIPTMT